MIGLVGCTDPADGSTVIANASAAANVVGGGATIVTSPA
jgi:hypothetical protein